MIAPDIVQKVKELEIHTRRILSGSRIGGNKTRQKGFGFEFDQLRSYQYGDDVRLIDWKSSARSGSDNLLVRQYFEERNRSIMICVDISASTLFGSTPHLKQDIIKQIAGVLALAGHWSQDKVGMMLFSDHVEKMIPPAKGYKHIHGLLSAMFAHQSVGKKTDFNIACDFIANRVAKKSIVLMVSDFIGMDNSVALKKIIFDKEVIAIVCKDPQEEILSDVGYIWMQDPESGQVELINTSGSSGQKLSKGLQQYKHDQNLLLSRSRIDVLYLHNTETFMHDLLMFFQKRMM